MTTARFVPVSNTVNGTTADPTRAVATFAVIPEMTLTFTPQLAGNVLAFFDGAFEVQDVDAFDIALFLDAAEVTGTRRRISFNVSGVLGVSGTVQLVGAIHALLVGLTLASHTVDVRWAQVAGTARAIGTERKLSFTEVL